MAYNPAMTYVDRARRAERVAKRYAEGNHVNVVAAEFGITPNYVYKIARLYEVNRPQGRPHTSQIARLEREAKRRGQIV